MTNEVIIKNLKEIASGFIIKNLKEIASWVRDVLIFIVFLTLLLMLIPWIFELMSWSGRIAQGVLR